MSSERRRTHVGKRYSSNGGYAGCFRVMASLNTGLALRPEEKRNLAKAIEERRRVSRGVVQELRAAYARIPYGSRMAWIANRAEVLHVSPGYLRGLLLGPLTLAELDAAHHEAMLAKAAEQKAVVPPAAPPQHIDDDEPIGGW